MALAVRARPGHDRERAVGVGLGRAVLAVEPQRCGDLDVRGDTDAHRGPASLGAAALLLGAQAVVVGRDLDRVERLLVLGVVVLGAGEAGHRELVGLQEVLPTHLERVHADLVGGHVDDALEQLGRLGTPGAAVGPGGRGVGDHGLPGEVDGRDVVDTLGHQLGQARQDRPDRRVHAAVADDRGPQTDDASVVLDAQLDVLHLGAPVHHREHVLRARLGPAHGASEVHRGAGGDRVLGVGRGLGAEAATHARGDHADLLGVEAQVAGERVAGAVRGLDRQPQGDAAVRLAGDGDGRVRLHGHAGETLVVELAGDDRVGGVEDALDLTGAGARDDVGAVLLEDHRGALGHGLLDADHRGQRVDVGQHRLGGVERLAGGLGDDGGDDVADEPHAPAGQRRTGHRVGHDAGQAGPVGDLQIAVDVDPDDTRLRARLLDVHGVQRPVRHGRAHEDDVQRALDRQVTGVALGPGDQPLVLGALDRVTEDRSGPTGGDGHRCCS